MIPNLSAKSLKNTCEEICILESFFVSMNKTFETCLVRNYFFSLSYSLLYLSVPKPECIWGYCWRRNVEEIFLGKFIWVPIPYKWYQNTSGFVGVSDCSQCTTLKTLDISFHQPPSRNSVIIHLAYHKDKINFFRGGHRSWKSLTFFLFWKNVWKMYKFLSFSENSKFLLYHLFWFVEI